MAAARLKIFLLIMLGSASLCAQQTYKLQIFVAENEKDILKKIDYQESFKDSLKLVKEINQTIQTLHSKSYLTAGVDSILNPEKKLFHVHLSIGNPFYWVNLSGGNLPSAIIQKVDFSEKLYRNKKFSYSQFYALEKRILSYAENNGYPFASIGLDSLYVNEESLKGALLYKQGPLIIFDSIGVVGKSNISRKFLSHYLMIKKGDFYDERKITNTEKRLQRLQIFKINKAPEIRFVNGKAYPYFFLEDNKTSSIDGIAGLQQDKVDKNKLLITGEFNIRLKNILNSGKQAALSWRKFDRNSQVLNTEYRQYALFGSPVNFRSKFDFLRQDSTFIVLNPRVGFNYDLHKYGNLGFIYEMRESKITDTNFTRNLTVLPSFADNRTSSYGLTYEWDNLDNFFLPHKGIKISAEASVGNKKIKPVLDEELYKDIRLNTVNWQGSGAIENHMALSKNFTLMQRIQGGYIINDNLFMNDLQRLGGINSIRGFREAAFFASKYLIETLEMRFFTEENSYLMAFVDYGQYVAEAENAWERNFPLGIGAGLSFSTKAGIFNMVYAVGKDKNSTFNFSTSVVNFGLINRF